MLLTSKFSIDTMSFSFKILFASLYIICFLAFLIFKYNLCIFNFTLYLFLLPGLHLDNHFCNPFNLFSFIFTSFFNFSPFDVTIKSLIPKSNPTIDVGFNEYLTNGTSTRMLTKYLIASLLIVADFILPTISLVVLYPRNFTSFNFGNVIILLLKSTLIVSYFLFL